MTGPIQLTKVTTKNPPHLSKGFSLGKKGEVIKAPGGSMVLGFAERLTLENITDLAKEYKKLTPVNALTYGVTEYDRAKIVIKKVLDKVRSQGNGGPPVIARTREFIKYSEGAGVLMFDYDPPEGLAPMTGDGFLQAVYEIAPAIAKAPHMLAASCSSFIFNGEKELIGPKGWRLLVIVERGTDIPRAGADFVKRCWLKGQGYIAISKAGSYLERALVDASVYQPERLDFCGGADCKAPLIQRRPDPKVYNPDAEPLNTTEEIQSPSLTEEEEIKNIIQQAKADAEPEAQKIREGWIEARIKEGLKKIPKKDREEKTKELRATLTRAVNGMELTGDFVLYPEKGGAVTVAEILGHPDKWHAKRFCDPLEPDYNNDKRISFVNLKAAGRPFLFSHAHGGRRFALRMARHVIKMWAGERVATVRNSLAYMKKRGQHFQRGNEIVTVNSQGTVFPRDEKDLLYDLDEMAVWEKYDARVKDFVITDCKHSIAAGIKAARASWRLPELVGVATAPTMDPGTGRLIDTDGYDKQSGLLLILNDPSLWPGIPKEPNILDVEKAVKRLWSPFEKFPFDNSISRGVWLNTILTAAVRPLLPTALGILITSPTAASGKTLLAKCAAEISGDIPALLPVARDPEEIRKRLLPLLRENKRIMILDNVVGTLDSPPLCAMLTAEIYQDRVLGASETISVPTRSLVIVTGNNVTLRGDLCRRMLRCRIDPKMETPWKRAFDLDPVQYCKINRFEMIRDALTILRAGMQNGPKNPDRTASFEVWSDTVRRAVCFIAEDQFSDFLEVADPVKSIDVSYEMDPETSKLTALIAVWNTIWQEKPVKIANLIQNAMETLSPGNDYLYPELRAALDEIAGEGKSINSRRLGRWVERNHGRIVNKRYIEPAGYRDGVRIWKLKKQGV